MKYAVEMVSVAVIYVHSKFHKDWFRHSKVHKGGNTDTETGLRSHKTILGKWANNGSFHSSGGQLPASHCGGPGQVRSCGICGGRGGNWGRISLSTFVSSAYSHFRDCSMFINHCNIDAIRSQY
jgi:hypothetical protein